MTQDAIETWLHETDAQRALVSEYSDSPLPTDLGERHLDFDKAVQMEADADDLLSQAEELLIKTEAKAIFTVRQENSGIKLSPDERRILIKASVSGIKRIADSLRATKRKIGHRIYIGLNANRSR